MSNLSFSSKVVFSDNSFNVVTTSEKELSIDQITKELIQKIIKNANSIQFTFSNNDILIIETKIGDFFNIGNIKYCQVTYGEFTDDPYYQSEDNKNIPAYLMACTQYFPLVYEEEAIECFLNRLHSDSPEREYGKSYNLDEIKKINDTENI